MRDIRIVSTVLAIAILTSGLYAAQRRETLDLTGRKVVVTIYASGHKGSDKRMRKKKVVIQGRTIDVDFSDANDATTFALVGDDQKDQLIRQIIGSRTYRWSYRIDKTYSIPVTEVKLDGRDVIVRLYPDPQNQPTVYDQYAVEVYKKRMRVLNGVTGEPMAGASVRISSAKPAQTDDQGLFDITMPVKLFK